MERPQPPSSVRTSDLGRFCYCGIAVSKRGKMKGASAE